MLGEVTPHQAYRLCVSECVCARSLNNTKQHIAMTSINIIIILYIIYDDIYTNYNQLTNYVNCLPGFVSVLVCDSPRTSPG